MRHSVLDDSAEGIGRGTFWKWKLIVSVLHAFRSNHDDMKLDAREYVGKLEPNISWEGGFSASSEDKDADWRWIGAKAFDIRASTCSRWVKGVSECWIEVSLDERSLKQIIYQSNSLALPQSIAHLAGYCMVTARVVYFQW